MAGKQPPTFVIPPAPSKGKGKGAPRTEAGIFAAFINKHPGLKPYAQAIETWANTYGGITPSELAAAIWTYTGGKVNAQTLQGMAGNPKGLNANKVPFVTNANPATPNFIVQAIAWKFSGAAVANASPDAGYTAAYGAGAGGSAVSHLLPAGYVGSPKTNASAGATKSVTQSAVTGGIKDPYVAGVTSSGKILYVNDPSQLPKTAPTEFGLPVTRSQFLQFGNSIDNTYLAYTGKRATSHQVAQAMEKGWSQTQLQTQLSASPAFRNSPVWKQNAPSYTAAWQNIYGPNSKPDPKALRYAIVHNLDPTAFEETLRSRPDYTKSLEFKKAAATLSGEYTQIYGVPDANGNKVINQAAKNGYSSDQFANYLRKQPQYTSSDEFKGNALAWAKSMGLLSQGPLEANAGLATATTPGPTGSLTANTNGTPPPPGSVVPPTGQSGYAQASNANLH